jgi:hypothetical protein
MYYAKSTGGFYTPDINPVIPADAVEITDEEHKELLDGQSNGYSIAPDVTGRPYLVAPPPAEIAERTRIAAIDSTIEGDVVIQSWKVMSNSQFDAAWATMTAGINTIPQLMGLLKRIARIIVRRLL